MVHNLMVLFKFIPIFQGKLDVAEFIGSASERLIAESKADNGRA